MWRIVSGMWWVWVRLRADNTHGALLGRLSMLSHAAYTFLRLIMPQ